jgi:hypothetical protein
MLMAWARGKSGNLLPLIWIVLVSKSFDTGMNIITKYQIIFLRQKFFEWILKTANATYFIILLEKIPLFECGTYEFRMFFRQIQITSVLRSCFNQYGSDQEQLASNVGLPLTLSPSCYPSSYENSYC